jgi:hypothetical protein
VSGITARIQKLDAGAVDVGKLVGLRGDLRTLTFGFESFEPEFSTT